MAENTEPGAEPKISKNAAAKAAKKAEKALKKAENKAIEVVSKGKEKAIYKPAAATVDPNVDPMDACFGVGWLKDVYGINPAGEKVRTRFPPEPNGFLHIGHAKAIAVNFGFAKFHGGKCNLRYDDTNPAAEKEKYFISIKEMIEWLGYKPYEITYSSDNFDILYELAEALIKKDKAYVCHCTQEQIVEQKGGADNKHKTARFACLHRNRPIEESIKEFQKMREGYYEPKEAVLRMKMMLIESGNASMWDLPAYRVVPRESRIHHKTGDKWVIYPTYDFTHCLCDAFEEITHSMCTVEFRTARESYDWLLEQLKEFLPPLPQQREYSRLSVDGTVLSKRKILKLVDEGIVRGWDDPRLYTLIALRRRGIPPGAIRAFVAELGVSDALATSIQLVRLDTAVRKYLEKTVPRLMLIPDPITIIIDNLPEDYHEDIVLEFMRGDASMGTHTVPFTRKIYIDRSDFREEDSEDFFRLAPGKPVGLLNVPYPIKADSFTKDPTSGQVTEIRASCMKPEEGASTFKPKAFIQWVADSPAHNSPIRCEVRIFNSLFKSNNPDDAAGGFLNDLNPKSEESFPNAVLETGFEEVRKGAPWPKDHVERIHPGPWDVRFQGMRVAYFAMDTDSTSRKLVLNKIVGLKEDQGKAADTKVLPLR